MTDQQDQQDTNGTQANSYETVPIFYRHLCHLPPIQRLAVLVTQLLILTLMAGAAVAIIYYMIRGSGYFHVPGWIYFILPLYVLAVVWNDILKVFFMHKYSHMDPNDIPVRCGFCGYDLRAHQNHTICPECGVQYTMDRLREYWRRVINLYRNGDDSTPLLGGYSNKRNYLSAGAFTLVLITPAPLYFFTGMNPVALALMAVIILLCNSLWKSARKPPLHGVRRLLLKQNRCPCLKCGRRLSDQPPQAHCPKCGVFYDIEENRKQWRQACPPHWEEDVIIPSLPQPS